MFKVVPILFVEFGRRAVTEPYCVVVDDIYAAKGFFGALKHLDDLGGLAHVGADENGQSPPSALIPSTTCWPPSALTSATQTDAPSRART